MKITILQENIYMPLRVEINGSVYKRMITASGDTAERIRKRKTYMKKYRQKQKAKKLARSAERIAMFNRMAENT